MWSCSLKWVNNISKWLLQYVLQTTFHCQNPFFSGRNVRKTAVKMMVKWWHRRNWGKAACERRTRTLESNRNCASRHSKLKVPEICPYLFVISPPTVFLWSLAEEASLISNFSFFHFEFPEILAHFQYHGTSFFTPTKAISHLASLSRRYFGTRLLNRENSEVAYWCY